MGRESRARAARTASIRFAVCQSPDQPEQELPNAAVMVLRRLLDAGALREFSRLLGRPSPDGLGDCHETAHALMYDLIAARAADGWFWVTGRKKDGSAHSWLECASWAVDASSGMRAQTGGDVLVAEKEFFRSHYVASSLVVRSSAQVEAGLRVGDTFGASAKELAGELKAH